jgi:putative transposase
LKKRITGAANAMARAVVAGYPHHVTQRGNRRHKTFFYEGDYQAYIKLMSEHNGGNGDCYLLYIFNNGPIAVAVPIQNHAVYLLH